MSEIVISVESLSKQYRLGTVGTGTLSHDLNRFWHKIRGKDDPYIEVGQENDRTSKGTSDYVWALRDINFEVRQGEVLGIIGRNGAGKSTLLKLLSRTTSPTIGTIKMKGRIASLLEVGTGFHPELSGKENIYLNGAILGMTRQEINSKFNEIVEFAGVERYVNTPVKRYSSGMYVRLAFAVAAYLEPDILIVDEVLAVGDAEFQQRAIGKLKDVSAGQGRTVLFVSHNMGSIAQLCTKGLLLHNGKVASNKNIDIVIEDYLEKNLSITSTYKSLEDNAKNVQVLWAEIVDEDEKPSDNFSNQEDIYIRFEIKNFSNERGMVCSIGLQDQLDRKIFTDQISIEANSGYTTFKVKLHKSIFRPNRFKVSIALHIPNIRLVEVIENALAFELVDSGSEFSLYGKTDNGFMIPPVVWEIEKNNLII
ncbi:lipopolysaccharide transport system ATP-binding protein [Pontibacter aydingkolensis]|uniref:ATP-binding cassette domain-containing protein n=1 Tax=Pontibacter aydingkolensis TaxID=1911536 RepID=A0ABS7CTV1_9BACT|nr:ABC transporter ATP-binding protein [Pontibacter aydingkolensis]MBW7467225.1 ATP-binding cassette domain-containing protein [Pontibacter aydingkolensis]